jgi:glycosyltransferase involved in cell wall biosynthesis
MSLVRSLGASGHGGRAGVVQVVDFPVTSSPADVVAYLQIRAPEGHRAAAAALNTFDVAVIQHDSEVFGGRAGDQLLAVLDLLTVPVVLVVHGVPAPALRDHSLLQRAIDASLAVVVMSEAARQRLLADYIIDPAIIVVIPYGAPWREMAPVATSRRPVVLTWGLIRSGKGIEWAIDALQQLRRLEPRPTYVVAGVTHPRERDLHGEAYRVRLRRRARASGVADLVRFVGSYVEPEALRRFVDRADVVLLPYDSRDQVSSAVLVEAVSAGRPVVATAFPHAVELLAGGAGILVPQYDATAIGDALHRVLTQPDVAARMVAESSRLSAGLMWSHVADRYRRLLNDVLAGRPMAPVRSPVQAPAGAD